MVINYITRQIKDAQAGAARALQGSRLMSVVRWLGRMDQVEEDGMQLQFEHRHSLHASHPSSSLSLEQDEDKSEIGGEARAGHASGVPGESVQLSMPASSQELAGEEGKMHATTARNNGFLRYLHGVPALSFFDRPKLLGDQVA